MNCTVCGTAFVPKSNTTGLYCSSRCWYAVDRRTPRSCQRCGGTCYGKSTRKFCTKVCANAALVLTRAASPDGILGCRWIGVGTTAHALVDETDFDALNRHMWRLYKGAAATMIGGRPVQMHRMLVRPPAGYVVDHANGNRLDNRRANLRVATEQQNAWNSQKKRRGLSRYKGVTWAAANRKWMAMIRVDEKAKYIGLFESERAAAMAYDAEARLTCGEFACVNFPQNEERCAVAGVSVRAFRFASRRWFAATALGKPVEVVRI